MLLFADGQIEAQRGEVTCSGAYSRLRARIWNLDISDCKAFATLLRDFHGRWHSLTQLLIPKQ